MTHTDLNHSLFWRGLAPVKEGGGELPRDSEIAKAIERDFGSFENLKTKWTQAALGIQGSGWAWLGFNPATKRLEVSTTPNQDPLLSSAVIVRSDSTGLADARRAASTCGVREALAFAF